jgi:Rieske Fe-S protein
MKKGNRRQTLRVLGGLIVCGGGAFGIVHYVVRREASVDERVILGPLAESPVGEFQKRTVTVTEHGTWVTGPVEKTVWLRRNPDGTCVVFSGTCPHRNCTVNLEGKTFHCPCHHSRFDSEGQVLSLPALRSLDTLEYRVSSNGIVSIEFQNYKKEIPTKELIPSS